MRVAVRFAVRWIVILASLVHGAEPRPMTALDLWKVKRVGSLSVSPDGQWCKDYRVPLTQGLAYFNTLRQKGVPTRLVYFPDENHWILKPNNSLVWHKEVLSWLEKYISHGPTKSSSVDPAESH